MPKAVSMHKQTLRFDVNTFTLRFDYRPVDLSGGDYREMCVFRCDGGGTCCQDEPGRGSRATPSLRRAPPFCEPPSGCRGQSLLHALHKREHSSNAAVFIYRYRRRAQAKRTIRPLPDCCFCFGFKKAVAVDNSTRSLHNRGARSGSPRARRCAGRPAQN